MKTFTQFVTELKTALTPAQPLDEATVHLAPHGTAGTHYKVVKGLPGQLEKGEVIHDSHIDDLHDVGIKTKILANEDMNDEERLVFEAADVTDLDDLFEDEEQIDEKAPDFNAPERSEVEEKKIATGEIHGDYKGHRAAMQKKHGKMGVKPVAGG